jgi:putative acetyltransferase
MLIRPYQADDLVAVANVFTESVHELAAEHYDAAQRATWAQRPPDLDAWATRLAPLITLVAEEDGQVAGFLSYTTSGYIDLLFTSPRFARRGVASQLYAQVEAELTAHAPLTLSTHASLVARPFFERQGFSVIQEEEVERGGLMFRRFVMEKRLGMEGCSEPEQNRQYEG